MEKPLHFLFDSPSTFDNYIRIRDYVNTQENRKFTSWFYGLGNILIYHLFENDNIITDRHLVSNFLWSGNDDSKPVYECLVKLIGKPDITILLYADTETLKHRLRNRAKDDKDLLIKRINDSGLNIEDYSWYIDLRKYGTVPHVGFGLGLERLLVWMLDLDNIIDSIPFPRTTRRFYP